MKRFVSDAPVRWCPGCGNFTALRALQKTLAALPAKPEREVVISGIGCSSRLPFFINTYGFHTLHGRAPTVATGLKCARPDLTVWIVTGDGDALSIGTNHLVHCLRRNVDVKILLFNNRVFGLTTGQYSPTSVKGQKSPSSPQGTIEEPINPLEFALACGAAFVARTFDRDPVHMEHIFKEAGSFRGSAFVEIYQSCGSFNPEAYENLKDGNKESNTLYLEDGKPMLFGKNKENALRWNGQNLQPVRNSGRVDKTLLHRVSEESAARARALSQWEWPVVLGVFRKTQRPTFDALLNRQSGKIQKSARALRSLLERESWKV